MVPNSVSIFVVRSRSKCQRQRPDPAKRVGSGLRSRIGPHSPPLPWDPRLPEIGTSTNEPGCSARARVSADLKIP